MSAFAQKTKSSPSSSFSSVSEKSEAFFGVQAKLNIGKSNDKYEVEADSIADKIVSKKETQKVDTFFSPAPVVQKKQDKEIQKQEETENEIQEKPLSESITPVVQLQPLENVQQKCDECAHEEKNIQKKGIVFPELPKEIAQEEITSESAEQTPVEGEQTAASAEAPENVKGQISLPKPKKIKKEETEFPEVQTKKESGNSVPDSSISSTLDSSRGSGSSLPSNVKSEMNEGFGSDFSNVKIHTNDSAVQMNKQLGSHAFTTGNDIYFNENKFSPDTQSGKHLLAHELTHTIQQGATKGTVQRFTPTAKTVTPESGGEKPNDGVEVEGKANNKIDNDPDVQEGDDLSEEERAEKESPDRSELRQEQGNVQAEGVSSPSVDRGSAAIEQTTAQQEELSSQLSEESPAPESTESVDGAPEISNMGQADIAAQEANQSEQAAQAVVIPEEPQPFQHPEIIAPVDSVGEALPRQASVDTQVRGLGYIGEMLRDQGYQIRRHAAQVTIYAYGQDAVIAKQKEDLALAKEGTVKIEEHNTERKTISEDGKKALDESKERQDFVSTQAPLLSQEADSGKSESSALAADASSKAAQGQNEIPDDPDARADGEQQAGEMNQTSEGALSMDQAITETGVRATQYIQDAQVASEDNLQSESSIAENDSIVAQIDSRTAEMNAMNQASEASIINVSAGPAALRQGAERAEGTGNDLIEASIVMETDLNSLQTQYLQDMAGIESKEEAEQRILEEQESASQITPEQQRLFEFAALPDDEQQARADEMEPEERQELSSTLDATIANTPEEGSEPEEPSTTEEPNPGDPRAPRIQEVDNTRTQRLTPVLDIGDQNMNSLTEEQQQLLSERLVAESLTDDIANINVLQMGRDMLMGMINPVMAIQGVVGGFEKTFKGIGNIFDGDAWERDPLGNLLQIGADISTGLAMVFSSILGIAGMITALMIVLTIFSWGTLLPVTGPVIAWMGTVMTYAGWGAIVSGILSVFFNSLAYIKNLNDAGTAETARELFSNTEEMKQNTTDGFQGAMAIVEGVGAVKMAPGMRSGQLLADLPPNPGALARQTLSGARRGITSLVTLPGRTLAGARRLFSGGRQGLTAFRRRMQVLFRRIDGPDVDINNPRVRTTTPDGGDLGNFQGRRVNAEMDLPDGHKARVLDDGQCVICSNCERIRGRYGDDLDANPDLNTELRGYEDRLRNNPNDADAIAGQRRIHSELTEAQTQRVSPRVRAMEERINNGDRTITRQEYEQYNRDRRLLDDNMEHIRTRYRDANPEGSFDDARIRQELESGRRFNDETGRFGNPNRSVSRRQQYLGSTPNRRSGVGTRVRDRMRSQGRLRDNPLTGREEVFGPIRNADGTVTNGWFDIEDADMGHHPIDAVDYWNNGDPGHGYLPGKDLPPPHPNPTSREWMTNPDNYELQHYGYNRSMGGSTTSRYEPATFP